MKKAGKYKPSAEDIIELSGIEILHPGGMALTKQTAEICNLKPGMTLLDVSCGRGTQSIFYAEQFGVNVTGIDLSPDMIQSSQLNAKKSSVPDQLSFKIGDSQELPFEDNYFDVVINECAVGIPDDPQKVLTEMTRVTKSGGFIAIHESMWQKTLSQAKKDEIANRYGTTPYSFKEWYAMLEKAGVSDIIYEFERWSKPEQFYKIRKDRDVKSFNDIVSFTERLYIIFKVFQRFGIRGLYNSIHNEFYFRRLVFSGTLGYCLFGGKVLK